MREKATKAQKVVAGLLVLCCFAAFVMPIRWPAWAKVLWVAALTGLWMLSIYLPAGTVAGEHTRRRFRILAATQGVLFTAALICYLLTWQTAASFCLGGALIALFLGQFWARMSGEAADEWADIDAMRLRRRRKYHPVIEGPPDAPRG